MILRRRLALALALTVLPLATGHGQGTFLKREAAPEAAKPAEGAKPNPPTPSASAPAPTPTPAPAPAAAPVPPAPLPPSPPAPPPIPRVAQFHQIPVASWTLLSLYVGQKIGFDALPRPFVSDWDGLEDCSGWRQAQSDEFVLEDRRQALRQALMSRPQVSRLRLPGTLQLGEYDFDHDSYALPEVANYGMFMIEVPRNACQGLQLGRSQGMPPTYRLRLSANPTWRNVLPVARAKAQRISRSLPRNRQVFSDLIVDLGAVTRDSIVHGSNPIPIQPVALFVWADAGREDFIGALGLVEPGAEVKPQVAAVAPTPSSDSPQSGGSAAAVTPSATPGASPGTSSASAAPGTSSPTPAPGAPDQSPQPTPPTAPALTVNTIKGTISGFTQDASPIVDGKTIRLYGITAIAPNMVSGFRAWLMKEGNYLECEPAAGDTYRCLTRGNVDVSMAMLVNGAARSAVDAPDSYRAAEQQARQQKRGIWR